jgi:hypothetical protein
MNQKKIINLTLFLIIGIAAVIGQKLWFEYNQKQPNEYLKFAGKIDEKAIREIVLSRDDQNLKLFQEDGEWKVAGKSADKAKINEFISSLVPSSSPTLIAQSDEKLQDLNVTEDTAVKVSLITKEESYDFLVGKRTATLTAVAISGRNQAYNLRNVPTLILTADYWYNLNIIDIESQNIKQFTISSGLSKFTLTQVQDREWMFPEEEREVNHDAVNTYLLKYNPLKSLKLAEESDLSLYVQAVPDFMISITDINDRAHKLEFYKGSDDYLASYNSGEEYYIISDFDAEDLNESVDKFTLSQKGLE